LLLPTIHKAQKIRTNKKDQGEETISRALGKSRVEGRRMQISFQKIARSSGDHVPRREKVLRAFWKGKFIILVKREKT